MFLKDNPEICKEVAKRVREHFNLQGAETDSAAKKDGKESKEVNEKTSKKALDSADK